MPVSKQVFQIELNLTSDVETLVWSYPAQEKGYEIKYEIGIGTPGVQSARALRGHSIFDRAIGGNLIIGDSTANDSPNGVDPVTRYPSARLAANISTQSMELYVTRKPGIDQTGLGTVTLQERGV